MTAQLNNVDNHRRLKEWWRYTTDQERRQANGLPRQSYLEWAIRHNLRRRSGNARQKQRGRKRKVQR